MHTDSNISPPAPHARLEIVCEVEEFLHDYVYDHFSQYFDETLHIEDIVDKLTLLGAIRKTVVLTPFGGGVTSTTYRLDCHQVLEHLGLIERIQSNSEIRYYTINEVADILRVTRPTVYNLINTGCLKTRTLAGIKGQRISKESLDAYLA